jgi:hypothetical protein
MSKLAAAFACAVLATGALQAETSDYPLGINLPTTEQMQFWDIGLAFTHRFTTPVQSHGNTSYGLDGYAYPALGFDFGIKPVKGLNALIYRTADNKTVILALQQRVLDLDRLRLAVRVERFDEVVPRTVTPLGTVGISGATLQVPAEVFITDEVILSLVPTYLSRTTTQEKGVFNVGVGLRAPLAKKLSFMGEFYPRPAKIAKTNPQGYAAGLSYKTFKHRFTVIGTNSPGTTANQVLSGDYGGGPRPSSRWSLGFNLVRTF